MFPYDPIESCLRDWGLETEKLEGRTFIQRRFANSEERNHSLERLAELGIDPTGKEEDGSYHAEFYLSRPPADIEKLPLAQLLADG